MFNVGDLVTVTYTRYFPNVGTVQEVIYNDNHILYKVNGCKYAEKFIRTPTEDELLQYELEQHTANWVRFRQESLKNLKFRHIEIGLTPEQKEILRQNGYFSYDLRDWDTGIGYNIECNVLANNIGNMVTDIDLTPYMNEGNWIGSDELEKATMEDLPYEEIKKYV